MGLETTGEPQNIVRVSFFWVVLGVFLMLGLGVVGGLLAVYIWPPQVAPLPVVQDQLVSTVQEVTISPNTAMAEVLQQVDRSIVHIATREPNGELVVLGTGFVVTNDGLVVTVDSLPEVEFVALDNQDRVLPMKRAGNDALFGLLYLQLEEGVLAPLDIRSENPPVAWEALLASRSEFSVQPRTRQAFVNEYVLTNQPGTPAGIQQLIQITTSSAQELQGSPLLDDEGTVGGLLLSPERGEVLPARHIRDSIQRMTSGQREFDPFVELGVRVRYVYAQPEANATRRLMAEVLTVARGSRGADAQLAAGDLIIGVGTERIGVDVTLYDLLANRSAEDKLVLLRDGRERTVSLPSGEEAI